MKKLGINYEEMKRLRRTRQLEEVSVGGRVYISSGSVDKYSAEHPGKMPIIIRPEEMLHKILGDYN